MQDEELLWKYYEQQIRQAEYYENSARGNVTNYLLATSAVIVSLTNFDEGIDTQPLDYQGGGQYRKFKLGVSFALIELAP